MANKYLIEQYKQREKERKALKEATMSLVPQIYACFAKVLYEDYKHTPAYIEKMFRRTQEVWDELVETDEMDNMIDWCEQSTGILLRTGSENEQ